MALIKTKNIEKVYSNDEVATVALRDITLTIHKGEFVGVMGPSGSGKSTLLHILGILDEPTGGTYLFNGKDVEDLEGERKAELRNRKIGFVFQAFNLLPRTSVLENVKLPLLYSGKPQNEWDERAKKVIEQVGLTHRISHEPSQLSGGEKQRVAIARALVNDPELIFADEPTGNLDTKSGQMIMKIIQSLHEKEGRTVILITHEQSTAEQAERIISLKDGAIISDTKVKARHNAQTG